MEFPEPHGNDGGIAARSSRITSRYGKSGLMMLDVFFFEGKVHYAFAPGFARRIICIYSIPVSMHSTCILLTL